ncbi:MAG: tRNA (adenosine(37)-N6)-threonylcarbamoyltransferase complex ATPase subunit type 1 TsaE [Pseudomonadota bacterium]
MTTEIPLPDEAATQAFAARLAPHLNAGHFIALEGGLGVGKTTFARALISAMAGAAVTVPSPTFTLVQTYDGPGFPIFHFDLYRLNDPGELDELGWEETVEGLCLVEWPARAGPRLPRWRMVIALDFIPGGRTAKLEWRGEHWQSVMDAVTA